MKLFIFTCFLLFQYSIIQAQPGCYDVFSFQFIDSTGKTIDKHHPDYKNYKVRLRLGTNKNNELFNHAMGSYDKVVENNNQLDIEVYNYIDWYSGYCYPVEFLEVLITHNNDSMYIQLTGEMGRSIMIDSIVFKPGYKYCKTLADPSYEADFYDNLIQEARLKDTIVKRNKIRYAGNCLNPVFNENDFSVVDPIQNYIPISVRSVKSTNHVVIYFLLPIKDVCGERIDIKKDVNRKKKKINLEMEGIIIKKEFLYSKILEGKVPELILSRVTLEDLEPGTYKLIIRINHKDEHYQLKVQEDSVSLEITEQHRFLKLY